MPGLSAAAAISNRCSTLRKMHSEVESKQQQRQPGWLRAGKVGLAVLWLGGVGLGTGLLIRGLSPDTQRCDRLATVTFGVDPDASGTVVAESVSLKLIDAGVGGSTTVAISENGWNAEVRVAGNRVVQVKNLTLRHFGWYSGQPKIGVDRCFRSSSRAL
jgi:hypothetical protein